jgi:LuxR family maltose regulon positive regulatory protein
MADNRYAAHMAAVMSSLAGLALTLHFLGRADESAAAVELLQDHAVETADPGNLVIAESARARLELLRAAPAVPPDPGALGDAWSSMVTSFIFLEAPAVTRCRVLASQGPVERLEQAVAQLEDLENEAAAFHNTFQLVDLVALKAVTLARLERLDEATDAVRRALEMAAPGGWQRPFIELGPPMAELLRGLGDAGCRTQVDGLLERIGESRREAPSLGNGRSRPGQALIDPLTERELDVLELLAERLYYKEIAAKLCVSKATVKTHVRHIYQKLDAPNRRQAVIKAEEAGLL